MQRLLASEPGQLLIIAELVLQPQSIVRCWDGLSLYYIASHNWDNDLEFPSKKIMKRLARKFLDSDYDEKQRECELSFYIKSGSKLEDRAAFLAAVATHTKIKNA